MRLRPRRGRSLVAEGEASRLVHSLEELFISTEGEESFCYLTQPIPCVDWLNTRNLMDYQQESAISSVHAMKFCQTATERNCNEVTRDGNLGLLEARLCKCQRLAGAPSHFLTSAAHNIHTTMLQTRGHNILSLAPRNLSFARTPS